MRPLVRIARCIAFVLVAALGWSSVASAQSLTRIRFQLDWRFDGQAAPFLLGNAKGYFRQEGLDVQFDAGAGSALAVTRVASGNYDLGYGDTSALIEFLSNNYAIPAARVQAVFMVLESTPAAVVMLKKSNVKQPKELVGKTLGAPSFDAGRKLWPLFARAVGVDPNAVKWQTMEPALREQMLVRGQVDAVTGFQPSTGISAMAVGAKEEELQIFNYKDFGVRVYGNAILANPRFVQENPKAIAGFLRAYMRSLRETIADPEAAIRILKEREPIIDSAVELRRLRGLLSEFVLTPTTKSEGIGAIRKLRLENQVEDVVKAFNLKMTPNPDEIFNSSFLPPASMRRLDDIVMK
jgi:NitT/TauT family transport system substrate-binding protein